MVDRYSEACVRAFAENELSRYLGLLGVTADIRLGLFADFGIELEVENTELDDAIAISVKEKSGFIAGSNERSVLIGVYRFLSEWGIGWVRPGQNGTHIPTECACPDIEICEAASNRYREICIEGAVSIENVLDMIDWMPKAGFNSYYIQFKEPRVFFDRWYSHITNPLKKPEPFTDEMLADFLEKMTEEIKKRGLLLAAVGHGWTCFPFGVNGSGWYVAEEKDLPEDYLKIVATVNGKREIPEWVTLNAQLCYSNPFVVDTMVNAVIEYAENNPQVDIIGFGLGDSCNAQCECPACQSVRTSEHYVRMINRITDKLTEKGLKHKICAALYYNTSHPPKSERIKHPERVILTVAPITRNYAESLPFGYSVKEIPEYKHNGFDVMFGKGNSVSKNLAYLYAWQKDFTGMSTISDYHLMWDHILDAGGEGVARVLYDDIRAYGSLGISGLSSIQVQCCAFPSSIILTTMARTLWNTDTDFETVRRELYAHAFGKENADAVCDYFSTLSRAFKIGAIRNLLPFDKDEFKRNMQAALEKMQSFGAVIEKNLSINDACQRASWSYLVHHRHAYSLIGRAILLILDGDRAAGDALRIEAGNYVFEHEDELNAVLDSRMFERITRQHITIDKDAELLNR